MRRLTVFFLVMLFYCNAAANPDHILGKTEGAQIQSLWLLPDNGYDLKRVLNDTTLHFRKDIPIEYGKYQAYWIRFMIANPSNYGGDYFLRTHPQIENTFFNFDLDSGKWVSHKSGLLVADRSRITGAMPFSIPADTACVYYMCINISRLSHSQYTTNPGLYVYSSDYINKRELLVRTIWLCTLCVVVVFFLYNAYVWYFFRDRTYLYYLLIQLGAMGYITGFHGYYNLILPFRHVNFHPVPNGNLYFYELNNLIVELTVVMIMTGFIQLTRTYLETRQRLPVWDKILRYFNYIFSAFTLTSIVLTGTGVFYLDYYTAFYINLGVVLIILLMLLTGVVSVRKKYKPGKYFLLANTVTLVIMLCLAAYFVLYKFSGEGVLLLPSMAIVSQSVALAIALVARVQLLKDQLHEKEMAVEQERSKNEKLSEKLEYNQRELASSAMFAFQKNKLLADLKRNIEQLSVTKPEASTQAIKKIKSTIQSNMLLDADWDKFKLHFEQVHPGFFDDLRMNYPNLTQNEIRLSAYLKINLSVKEIAALMNIDPESVRKAKTRLNKKINQTEANPVE